MARLIVQSPDGKLAIIELRKPVISIGRGSANDVVLNDTSVSRFHAVVKRSPAGVISIADRGSTNGVSVNGARIIAETHLADGDSAKIGVYSMRFESLDESRLTVENGRIAPEVKEVLKPDLRDVSLSAHRMTPVPGGSQAELALAYQKLERENHLLHVLYDAGQALNAKLSLDDIETQVMELAFRIEGVERGFLMLFDAQGLPRRQSEVRYRAQQPAGSESGQSGIILGQTILDRIRKELLPILITDVHADERFSAAESVKISGLRSAMCAPLLGANHLLGVLYVDNLQRARAFAEEELGIFSLVAAQAAAAIDNALAYEQLAESKLHRSALERFLSPEVVELIAANPDNVRLGGTNQKVSVMFADIRGFTTMSEQMAPEKVVEVLNEYFTRVTDVIFDHGGTLDKYVGDEVMAVFGAPLSKGNDAANAVRTAIEIEKLLVEMNRDAAARGWPELRVGIGINTGIVTAGNIGSPKRLDYTVIGDTVNTASRIMGKATGGQIIIAEATAHDLEGKFKLKALPPIMAKGKSEPVPAFEVEWQ